MAPPLRSLLLTVLLKDLLKDLLKYLLHMDLLKFLHLKAFLRKARLLHSLDPVVLVFWRGQKK